MTGKVGGPSESSGEEQKRILAQQQKKIERIEKLSETDPDQRARKRKFDEAMGMKEEEAPKKGPSPFEPSFHTKNLAASPNLFTPPPTTSPELIDLENQVVPSPSYTPAPNLSQTPPEPLSHEHTESDLPSSSSFFQGPSNPTPTQKERTPSFSKKPEHEIKEPLIKKPILNKEKEIALQAQKKIEQKKIEEEEKRKKTTPTTTIYQPPKEKEISLKEEKKPSKEKETLKTEKQAPLPAMHEREHPKTPPSKKESLSREAPTVIETPTPMESQRLPQDAIQFAQTATTQASHYLTEQTTALYFNMVSAIYMQRNAGISTTEILLNSPALANSRFFGAKIILEKYDTDPNSFNIRLTGTNEAVTLFNQNIPNLYAAFQNGKFAFRIGRIEAEYTTEKPIFQRKEPGKGKDLGGGFDQNKGSSR